MVWPAFPLVSISDDLDPTLNHWTSPQTAKRRNGVNPVCPHLIPTSKRMERVYEWELNKSLSAKALTWGRAQCLPCFTQCYLSSMTLTCWHSWGHLQGRHTAKTQANWRQGKEDFHMPLTDLFVDERLHCGLIFFSSTGVTFGCKSGINWTLTKGCLTRMRGWRTVFPRLRDKTSARDKQT